MRSSSRRRSFSWIALTLLIGSILSPSLHAEEKVASKSIAAPAWQLSDLGGKTIQLSDYQGKVVVLNFWATWCVPCRAEIPSFIELQKKYGDQGVVFLGLSADQEPQTVPPFVKSHGINYPILIATPAVLSAYEAQALPTTYLIDRKGNIVAKHVGAWPKDALEVALKQALGIAVSSEDLKKKLSPEQYDVTQNCGTEPPFHNAYWNNHDDGIYVDIVSGEPLFCSKDKFDSGTGWPSFTQPIDPASIAQKSDASFGMERTELRSTKANSHLGHLFDDGPGPTHARYCINSASLRFVPKDQMQTQGYGAYLKLFDTPTPAPTKKP